MRNNPYAEALKRKKKPLFVPFVVLGDPDRKRSAGIIRKLVENGADALELGLPFSDPPADGPVIQAADTRALKSGIRMDHCFRLIGEIRKYTDIPIGLLVYFNLVLQRGLENFYRDCAASGVDSVLIADLPLEHAGEAVPIAISHGIAPIFLISEVTSDKRLKEIAGLAEGYLYVVSYLGVTGAADSVLEEKMSDLIGRARKFSGLPLIAGFGINNLRQVEAAIGAGADGIIVGSRIVREINNPEKILAICGEITACLHKSRGGNFFNW